MEISELLKNLLREKKLPASRLARMADVSQDTVYRIRDGKTPNPQNDTLENLGKVLGGEFRCDDKGKWKFKKTDSTSPPEDPRKTGITFKAPGVNIPLEGVDISDPEQVIAAMGDDITDGMKAFLRDDQLIRLLRPNLDELEFLLSMRFSPMKRPTKYTYVHLLDSYRKPDNSLHL